MALFGSLESLLIGFGYPAIFGIVFAESGLFFGFFLPGDSLLFTAGLLAQQGYFDFWVLLFGVIISAILGDQVGYWMGNRYGRKFFTKEGDFFRDPEHIKEAEEFYKKHGKLTIVLARFVPVVRTFAPIVAGIGRMDYATFISYNVIGGILWSVSMISTGFLIGSVFPHAYEAFTVLIILIIVVSLAPVAVKLFNRWKKPKATARWPSRK